MQKKHLNSKHIKVQPAAKNHNVAKKSPMKLWQKIALAVGGAVIVIAATMAAWLFFATPAKDATELKIQTNQPAPTQFTDDNSMLFTASDNIPDVNNNRDLTEIQPLIVSYEWLSGPYQGAFKMNLTDKDLARAVKISPFVRGQWHMRGNSALVFTPESDWPSDKKFTVKISDDIFSPDIAPDSRHVSFTTPEITAQTDSFALYSDPQAKKSVIGIAVISFSYPIDTRDFNDKISLKLDDEKLDFTVKFDRFRRTAFIISAPVAITDTPQVMRLKLNRVSPMAGDGATKKLTAHATVESADNIFKISDITTDVADDNNGNAQQLILINTTAAAANAKKFAQNVNAYLLPRFKNADEDETSPSHNWAADEITSDVLAQSQKLKLTPMDFATPNGVYQYAFSYDVSEKNDRYIYVSVGAGAESAGGFVMKNGTDKVMHVPYPAKEVKIAGTGALLSLTGDKKLGIMARGGASTAYVNLYKVKSSEINHLISQTYNVFAQNMEFKSLAFGAYDMSVVFQKKISFAQPSMKRTNYASVDLGDYLDRTGADKTGIFIVQTGATQSQADYNDKRLILLTNLGIIRKVNLDESSSLFVSNLSDGTPATDAEIYVLGRNGNAVWAGRTDSDGHAELPKLAWSEYKNAREPVAIVARRDSDVSFIPYNAYSQRNEYSKFDTGGEYYSATLPMNAFIFSDRGIYRPGETMILGGIVKNKSFKSLAGVPVKIEISDARGRTTFEKTFSLAADGLFDIKYEISDTAPLGEWQARLYTLNSKNKPQDMIGMTSIRVEEFTPDTMKITAAVAGATENGWIAPDNLTANVSLRNLFGTPAANRKITARATLTPVSFSFPEYTGYTFTPNYISDTGLADNTARRAQTFVQELADVRTDDSGTANLEIHFDKNIPSGTYMLAMNIRGFEGGDGGKSVQTNITTRVSDAKYLVGYRADSDLSYVNRNASRTVRLVALDHTATPTAANDLTMRLILRENLTSLVKDYSGYYKYQTVSRDRIVSQKSVNIPTDGLKVPLDTTRGGTYYMQILDASDKILANVEYFVASDENAALQTDARSELQIKLNNTEFAPGDDIAVSITAPYAGAGLITIERDKVYAYRWFNAETTSSVQHITVPDGFEGTGYVNVSFVRDISSRDIFTSPYAFAAAPFSADISKRKISLKISAPDVITDNKLTVKYIADKSARMMIFAVNTGILQVAKYQIPNPLAHFFKKSALQVETYQILSLLLPEYKILREFAKTGGGDYGGLGGDENQILTNPFGRRTLPPVAFYSGIIDARANVTGQISFDIPDYFNGAVKIFAVAANNSAVGAADTETKIQSPVMITTSAPLMAAPGDSFDINAVITNMTANSGAGAHAQVSATVSDNLEITRNASADIAIAENSEKLYTFSVRAGSALGNADITVNAAVTNSDGKTLATRSATSTLSVRPATAFETHIKTGTLNADETTLKKFQIEMYPEFSSRRLFISANASALMRPLFEYLNKYDYPCTEQLTSRGLPYVLAPADKMLGTQYDASAKQIGDIINTLKNRQNDDGSFDLWAGGAGSHANAANAQTAQLTAYVAQFLTLAKDAGFTVSQDMLARAVDFLRTYAGSSITDADGARATAFAIYVITRNGYVTTSYIDLFEEFANNNIKDWESGIMGAYIAASYKIQKQDAKADAIISKYKTSDGRRFAYRSEFNNNVANDAIYYYLANQYFDGADPVKSDAIAEYINSGNYSAYTSAMVIMGLAGNSEDIATTADTISVYADDAALSSATTDGGLTFDIPSAAQTIKIQCQNCDDGATIFYSLLQQGFPTQSHAASNGIEIVREYYDTTGNRITAGNIGDTVLVKIFVRARGNADKIDNVVITDLLPTGFVPDADSFAGDAQFYEFREDRVLTYLDVSRGASVISYSVQLTTAGEFQVPPIHAASMYNPQLNATGDAGKFTVSNASEK